MKTGKGYFLLYSLPDVLPITWLSSPSPMLNMASTWRTITDISRHASSVFMQAGLVPSINLPAESTSRFGQKVLFKNMFHKLCCNRKELASFWAFLKSILMDFEFNLKCCSLERKIFRCLLSEIESSLNIILENFKVLVCIYQLKWGFAWHSICNICTQYWSYHLLKSIAQFYCTLHNSIAHHIAHICVQN